MLYGCWRVQTPCVWRAHSIPPSAQAHRPDSARVAPIDIDEDVKSNRAVAKRLQGRHKLPQVELTVARLVKLGEHGLDAGRSRTPKLGCHRETPHEVLSPTDGVIGIGVGRVEALSDH